MVVFLVRLQGAFVTELLATNLTAELQQSQMQGVHMVLDLARRNGFESALWVRASEHFDLLGLKVMDGE